MSAIMIQSDEPVFPHKNIRLHHDRYTGQISHFITICCDGRRPLLSNPARVGAIMEILRRESVAQKFVVDAYCAMPDHFHMLITGAKHQCNVLAFMREFKLKTTAEFRRRKKQKSIPPTPVRPRSSRAVVAATKAALWQKKFFDHILRVNDSFTGVAWYIFMNPVRAGLCADPRSYPYSGSLTLDWKRELDKCDQWTPSWKKSL